MNARLQKFDGAILLMIAVAAACVPLVFSGYEIKLATTIAIQAGLAVALGLVVGPAGLTSVGHAAFYGVAAYVLAMMAPKSEAADLLLTGAVAIVAAAAFAFIVGAVSIRSRGMYFILMTLAFGQLGYHLFNDTGIGGNSDGAYVQFRPELHLFWMDVSFDKASRFYMLVYVVLFIVTALCWWLRRSAFGSVLLAARDNEARTRAFGFSPYIVRLVAFVISGAMAGAMGYLTAAQHGFVAPQMLAWHASAFALVMVLIGGKDTTSGPIIGAVLLLLAEEILQRWTEHWLVGVGLIIVVAVIAAPRGVVPFVAGLFQPKQAHHG
jgi:branched-chain amino acid transport system permease protein